jgi:methionyl-tRNA formyltransferase
MRTAFVGAVEGSAVALRALAAAGASPDLVVTLPPERSTRHSDHADLTPLARAAGSEPYLTDDVNAPETIARLAALGLDHVWVIGWSQICSEAFMATARHGCIGFHPAPLPRMRGRAVIPWTILTGQANSGSTLFWLDAGTDSGPILAQRRFAVAGDETAATLYAKHTRNLEAMLGAAVGLLRAGQAPRLPQDHAQATYCAKRTAVDGWIEWQQPAEQIWRLIRAVGTPYPGAYTWYRDTPLTIWSAGPPEAGDRFVGIPGQVQAIDHGRMLVACGDGACLPLDRVQVPGQPSRPAAELLRVHVRLGLLPPSPTGSS